MTPTSVRPSRTKAIEMQKCGMPRAKLAVPSIGSTTQTSSPDVAAGFLAEEGVARECLASSARADQRSTIGVGCGEVVLLPLEVELKRGGAVAEMLEGELAGLAGDGAGRREAEIGRAGGHRGPAREGASRGPGGRSAWREAFIP